MIIIPDLTNVVGMTAPKLDDGALSSWRELGANNQARTFSQGNGLLVIVSIDTLRPDRNTEDGYSRWLHLSVSRRDKLPSWEELKLVKAFFIGPNRDAVHVLPRQSNYVNCHPYCLHLWSPEP